MVVIGEQRAIEFGKNHAAARKPLARFLKIVRAAEWPHFPAEKGTFATADYAPRTQTMVFDIGGNKYRLVARVDFDAQVLVIVAIMTHEAYDREKL